jgi:hypothetical protein
VESNLTKRLRRLVDKCFSLAAHRANHNDVIYQFSDRFVHQLAVPFLVSVENQLLPLTS